MWYSIYWKTTAVVQYVMITNLLQSVIPVNSTERIQTLWSFLVGMYVVAWAYSVSAAARVHYVSIH